MAEHRQACRPADAPFPRKRKGLTACFPRGLLMATQAVDLDPCLLRMSGMVLLGESRYRAKKESHLISMANCRRVGRKINRQDPITVEQAFMHHISAPHVKSDVPARRCPVRRFMYSISQLHIIAAVSYTHLRAHETRHDIV